MATGDVNAPEDNEKTRADHGRDQRDRNFDQRQDADQRHLGAGQKPFEAGETPLTPEELARQAQLALLSLLAAQGRRATILTGPRGDRSGDLIRPTILRGV